MNKHILNFTKIIERNKLFFQNLTYLSLLQGVNIIAPFITLPYLLHVLGKETYGLIIFAQAIISYLVILQNFGLNTLSVKEVSVYRNNKKSLSSIVSNVLVIKGFLFIISLLILWTVIFIFPSFQEYKILLFLTMWLCLFDFIFPRWYFQGIEKMKYITYISVVSKLIAILLIFTLIKSKDDYLRLPLINGIASLFSGIAALIIIFKYHKIKFSPSGFTEIRILVKKAITFFISDVSVVIFAKSNKVIIGAALGMAEVAYYDLAEKIISTFKTIPLSVIRDSIYPRVAKTKDIKILHNISIVMGSYSIVIITILAIFAPFIVTLLGGEDMIESANVLRIFSISIFTTHISNYYLTVGLWSLGYEKTFRNLMVLSSLLFLSFYLILWISNSISIYSLTIIPTLVDIYVIIHLYYIYKKRILT